MILSTTTLRQRLFETIKIIILLNILISCMNNNTLDTEAITLPTTFQPITSNEFKRAVRLEGAWSSAANIASIDVENSSESKINNFEILNYLPDRFISTYQVFSERNLQTGNYGKIDSVISQSTITNDNWAQVPLPTFIATPTYVSDKVLLDVKQNISTGEMISLWRFDRSVYLASYEPISGWKKSIRVEPNLLAPTTTARLLILSNDDILVWLSNNETQGGTQLIRYSDSLAFLSTTIIDAVLFDSANIIETQNGLFFVWHNVINSTTQAIEFQSLEYDWLTGSQIIRNIKTFTSNGTVPANPPNQIKLAANDITKNSTYISSSWLHKNSTSNEIELIVVLAGSINAINAIRYMNGRWSPVNRLDNRNEKFKILLPEIGFFSNTDRASIVWVAQSLEKTRAPTNNPIRPTQHIVYSELSNSGSWSVPIAVSDNVITTPSISLAQPNVIIDREEKLISWIENGPDRSEIFASRYSGTSYSETTWGMPELVHGLYTNNLRIQKIQVSTNKSGSFLLGWQQVQNNPVMSNISIWSSIPINQGTIVQPPNDTPWVPLANPTILSSHWTVPEQAWNHTFSANLEHHIYGPDIFLSNAGDAFLSLHKGSGFNPAKNEYQTWRGHVLHKTSTNAWLEVSPFAEGNGNTTFIDIRPANNSGNAYALWTRGGMLFFNYFTVGAGWETAQPLGFETKNYKLMVDSLDNAYLYWQLNGAIFLAQYVPGIGLQSVETQGNINAISFIDPIIQTDDSIYLSWVGTSQNSDPFVPGNQLFTVRFEPGIGWGEILMAPRIASAGFLGTSVTINTLPNKQLLAIAPNTRGNLYASVYSPPGGWKPWQNIDYNLDLNDSIQGHIRVATNSNHDVILTWSEETSDELGATVFRVYSNQFNPIADANGLNWPYPQRISSVAALQDSTAWHAEIHPQIAVSNTGRAIAVWIDEDEITSKLLVNEYTPETGWGQTPETLISYTKGSEGIVDAPRIAIADDDSTLITWRQRSRTEFAVDYRVWVVEKIATMP